jgi:hypothetical protein
MTFEIGSPVDQPHTHAPLPGLCWFDANWVNFIGCRRKKSDGTETRNDGCSRSLGRQLTAKLIAIINFFLSTLHPIHIAALASLIPSTHYFYQTQWLATRTPRVSLVDSDLIRARADETGDAGKGAGIFKVGLPCESDLGRNGD